MKKIFYLFSIFVLSIVLYSCTQTSGKLPEENDNNPFTQAVKNGFEGNELDWINSLEYDNCEYQFMIENGIIKIKPNELLPWIDLVTLTDLVNDENALFRLNYAFIEYKLSNSKSWKYLFDVTMLVRNTSTHFDLQDNKIVAKYYFAESWNTFIDLNTLNKDKPDPQTGIKNLDSFAVDEKIYTTIGINIEFWNGNIITSAVDEEQIITKFDPSYDDYHDEYGQIIWLIDYLSGKFVEDDYITVNFELDDEIIHNDKYQYGDKIQDYPEVDKEDYIFIGWYYCDVLWQFESFQLIDDITLQAKFGTKYNITYILEHGELPSDTEYEYVSGVQYELPVPIIDDPKIEFMYWENTKTGEQLTHIPADYDQDIELRAVYGYNEIPVLDLNRPIEIEFWHAMGYINQRIIEEIINEFNVYYPNIHVTQTSMGDYNTLRDTIISSAVAGITPTIAQTYPDHIPLYLGGDIVRELDSYINSTVEVPLVDGTHDIVGLSTYEQQAYIDAFWNEGKCYDLNGTMYSLPFNKSTEVLFYNKTIFDKYGYSVPQTWDDIIKICEDYVTRPEYQNLINSGRSAAVFSIDSQANFFITITQQWGGEYTKFDENGNGIYAFNNAQSKAAMSFLRENFNKGYFASAPYFGANYSSDAFKAQQCIMTVGSSAGATYNVPLDGSFEVGVAPYPQKDINNPYVIQQGTNVTLFKNSDKQVELAGWLFMKFLTSYESSLKWCTNTAYMPIRKDVLNSVEFNEYLEGVRYDEKGNKYYEQSIVQLAQLNAIQQHSWFYTSPAFVGSSRARDEAELIVQEILYSNGSIDDIYQQAIDNLKY